MKKKAATRVILLIILTLILFLLGCGKSGQQEDSTNNKITIYTTLFPLYDFVRQVGGEYVEVHSIIPAGAETHDFEPSAKDIISVNKADIFIYNGAGYEAWIENVIQNLNQEKTVVVDASSEMQLLELLHDSHSHGSTDEAHESTHTYDPHTWLDPMNAKKQASTIFTALVAVDPVHKAEYQANYDRFATELDALDARFQEVVTAATKHEVVVSHQAFGYLATRYGFRQIPIAGLSPSSEPSTKELQGLIELVKEHDLKYIAFDALVESKVAKTVQREAGVESVMLYTIENVTKDQLEQGVTYLQLMEENLESLKKVLEVQ